MTVNDDLKATDLLPKGSEILITGKLGSGKNFDLLARAVAAQKAFERRPGSSLCVLSSAATESISN